MVCCYYLKLGYVYFYGLLLLVALKIRNFLVEHARKLFFNLNVPGEIF